MQCNIDAKGKAVRLGSGLVLTLLGLVLLILAVLGILSGWWAWGLTVILFVCGGFQIFEGWAGWCVLRAMGFRTRI